MLHHTPWKYTRFCAASAYVYNVPLMANSSGSVRGWRERVMPLPVVPMQSACARLNDYCTSFFAYAEARFGTWYFVRLNSVPRGLHRYTYHRTVYIEMLVMQPLAVHALLIAIIPVMEESCDDIIAASHLAVYEQPGIHGQLH